MILADETQVVEQPVIGPAPAYLSTVADVLTVLALAFAAIAAGQRKDRSLGLEQRVIGKVARRIAADRTGHQLNGIEGVCIRAAITAGAGVDSQLDEKGQCRGHCGQYEYVQQ